MDVSIIIVNYNTVHLILDCIASVIEKTKDIEYEIIVVDNNSCDAAASKLAERFDGYFKYVQLPDNVGFGKANIEGYKHASGRNIFLLNPDTLLLNNAIFELCSYIDRHDRVAICGGNLYDKDLRPSLSHVQFGDILTNILFKGPCRKLFPNYFFNTSDKPLKVRMISGANMMIKRTIIEEIGFFDPDFFMYCEDNEFCYRVRQHHYTIVNIPRSRIMHLEGRSSPSEKGLALGYSGRATYILKTHSKGYLWAVCVVEYLVLFINNLLLHFFRKGDIKTKLCMLKIRRKCLWQSMKTFGFSTPQKGGAS